MCYDYSRLRGKIREKFGTEAAFAEEMGVSSVTLSSKLNNKKPFTQPEIVKAMGLLDFHRSQIADFFFCAKS